MGGSVITENPEDVLTKAKFTPPEEVTLDDEIQAGGATSSASATGSPRKLVPMRVGSATVYVEQSGDSSVVSGDDEIYTVAPDASEVFDRAVEAIRECVGKVGAGIETLAEKALPQELTVEFSLTFEAKAKGAIIPIFVTAEHGLGAGLKISAVWKREDMRPKGESGPAAEKPVGTEKKGK